MTPAMEVRLYMVKPGEGWEYTVRRMGEIIAASDGDNHYEHVGQALKAAITEAQATVKQRSKEGEQ
jgi:hypothetical protein